jgi:hypothetical protein
VTNGAARPGFGSRARQKVRERAEAFIASASVPQEPVVAGALVMSGLGREWGLLTPYIRLFGRSYYLALTERHLLFVWMSGTSGRPVGVPIVAPRDQVRITDVRLRLWMSGGMGSMLCYVQGRPGPMTLRFYRLWRPEVEALLAELGTAQNSP